MKRLALIALIVIGWADIGSAYSNIRAVKIAESQIGKGEIGGDNKGPEVKKYTKGKEVSWCAAFVSYCLRGAEQGRKDCYLLSALAYWKANGYRHVASPRPGDVIVLRRRGGGHVGIVEQVRGNRIITIEGNVGKYPAKVKRVQYQLEKIPNLVGFVRVI